MEKPKVKCPLLNEREISDDECYETCLVSENMLRKEAINKQFIEKDDFKEICLNCPHHDMD